MVRLARSAAALSLILTLGACGDAADTPDRDPVSVPADTEAETAMTPASEPTGLYIARVVKTTEADGGCLDSVRTNWSPGQKGERQRACGVQNDTEMWFAIEPATAFEATVTDAEATIPPHGGGTWVVTITLDEQSAQRFGQLATKLLSMSSPDPIALIVGGKVVSAPIPTPGLESLTTLQVAGDFSRDEAEGIAAALGAQ